MKPIFNDKEAIQRQTDSLTDLKQHLDELPEGKQKQDVEQLITEQEKIVKQLKQINIKENIRKASNKYKNLVLYSYLILIFGASILFVTNKFVIEPGISTFAKYTALILAVVHFIFIRYLYKNELWKPEPSRYDEISPWFKKLILFPITFLLVFWLYWINIAMTYPFLYTLLVGQKSVINDTVVKEKVKSSKSCDFRLQPKSIDSSMFHYCISKNLYQQLPQKELEAKLFLKKSSLGYIVKKIDVIEGEN